MAVASDPDAADGRHAAIVVAAGSASRMTRGAKQFLRLGGMPMLEWSVRALVASGAARVVVVLPPGTPIEGAGLSEPCAARVSATPGGADRAASVAAGLGLVEEEHVLVHDAARPFVSTALIERVGAALRTGSRAVVPAIPIGDTVKRVNDGVVVETVDRTDLMAVQTPQGFPTDLLRELHAGRDAASSPTDDALLAEAAGIDVNVVAGERLNFKVTVDDDFAIAEAAVAAGIAIAEPLR